MIFKNVKTTGDTSLVVASNVGEVIDENTLLCSASIVEEIFKNGKRIGIIIGGIATLTGCVIGGAIYMSKRKVKLKSKED